MCMYLSKTPAYSDYTSLIMSLKKLTSAGLKQKPEKRDRETNFTSLKTSILVEEIQKVNSVLFGKLDQKVNSQDKQKLQIVSTLLDLALREP